MKPYMLCPALCKRISDMIPGQIPSELSIATESFPLL